MVEDEKILEITLVECIDYIAELQTLLEDSENDVLRLEEALDEYDQDMLTVLDRLKAVNHENYAKAEKIANQRVQLQNYQYKLEAMKTWRGIVRTIGQQLKLWR